MLSKIQLGGYFLTEYSILDSLKLNGKWKGKYERKGSYHWANENSEKTLKFLLENFAFTDSMDLSFNFFMWCKS